MWAAALVQWIPLHIVRPQVRIPIARSAFDFYNKILNFFKSLHCERDENKQKRPIANLRIKF